MLKRYFYFSLFVPVLVNEDKSSDVLELVCQDDIIQQINIVVTVTISSKQCDKKVLFNINFMTITNV